MPNLRESCFLQSQAWLFGSPINSRSAGVDLIIGANREVDQSLAISRVGMMTKIGLGSCFAKKETTEPMISVFPTWLDVMQMTLSTRPSVKELSISF